ncbi:ABC transporter permease [Paracoccus shanxieyensis]|uniref:Autoinducer 2 import system permease protein LsrD n=1 Tax=Paracoccus shanxieyensis TaxID=2675752 RepID=A0A6L6IVE3_9RHOB|nr:ABC transporter permease [Paracoccus shanxieyensis]MTH64475.1 ABC transporter permease [Paracoccus shanxieyensis]MTH87532.1 ABC transporter permease [Paracoccus shanxieyensis]
MTNLHKAPWFWAWIAAFAAFGATWPLSAGGGGGMALLVAALTFGSFSVLTGLGQMLVITMGPGNTDLSIPATMTLAATLSLKLMNGAGGLWIVAGLLAALLIGVGVGIVNFALIRLLRIPPIIATLSASFLYQSLAIWSNRGLRIKPPQALADFTTGRAVLGIPNLAWVALAITVLFWIILNRARFGRRISAIGQNPRAARLAGVPVASVTAATYITCAVMAGLTGFLLACFSGGAALNMGAEFLLMSIAVTVIGGSSIAGGNSNVPGIWAGALFMYLIVSMLNSYGLGAGVRLLATGVIIIAIVATASGRKARL